MVLPFLAVDAGAGGAEGALADAHDAQDVLIALAFMLQNGEEDVRMSMRQLIEIERVKISSKSLPSHINSRVSEILFFKIKFKFFFNLLTIF